MKSFFEALFMFMIQSASPKSEYPGSQTVEKVFDNVGRLKLVTNGGEQTVYEYYNDGRSVDCQVKLTPFF